MTVSVEQSDLNELVDLVRQGAEANERPDLVRRLREAGGSDAEVAATVARALRSLEIDLRARRAALCDPGRGARLAGEARYAEARLRRFRERSAKWPRLLGDALSEADSDLEYAVQSRLRSLLDEGTAVIESGSKRGDDLDEWLRARLVAEGQACHQGLHDAADRVAGRLGTALELTVPPVTLELEPPGNLLRPRPPGARGRQPLAGRLLGIVMPTYSGMMVAIILPRLLGLTMPIWLIVAAAVTGALAMGGAALAGERQRQAGRRAAETIGDLRSALDAFRMAVGKQVRDGVRVIDQQLRSALDEAVDRATRRLSGAADAAREQADDSVRTAEAVRAVDADLDSVRDLIARAQRRPGQ